MAKLLTTLDKLGKKRAMGLAFQARKLGIDARVILRSLRAASWTWGSVEVYPLEMIKFNTTCTAQARGTTHAELVTIRSVG